MTTKSLKDTGADAAAAAVDPDDPFPAWLAEWEAAHAAYETGGKTEELDKPVQAAENKIIDTPTRTIAGVVAKLRMMVHLVEEVGHEPPDNLAATALAGAECVMRDFERLLEEGPPS